MSRSSFHHERVLTLTLLGILGVSCGAIGYKIIDAGLQGTTEKIFLGVIMIAMLVIVQQIVMRMLMRITIDHKEECVRLEYLRYSKGFFDVLPKRCVEVPFIEIVNVRVGLRSRNGQVFTWHVHTRESKFSYPAFMKNENQLRAMLETISIEYGDSKARADFICKQKRFELVIYIATGCVLLGAILYTVLMFMI